jgi:UDP-3-O-[3-hydroxymyristoyl] glucosamine N-acyltransferase
MQFNTPQKLSELAQYTDAKVLGDGNMAVSGINEIHGVEKGDITFVDHPKYYDKALNSAASFIIIDKEVPVPSGKALLLHPQPFDAYIKIVNKFRPFVPCAKQISETATIGKGTVIQPGAFIGNHVKIGDNCIIHSNVSIYDHTIIGNNVVIHANAVIGADAYYFKKKPTGYEKMLSCGRVIIHDNVELGPCCTIDKGVSADTIIGKGTKFDAHVHIGHDTVVGENVLMAAQTGVAGVTRIEDDVILWGQVGVNKDLVIGKGAVVHAQSGVSKSIAGGKVYFGSPVKEAREKLKELAFINQLPAVINELKNNKGN